MIDPIQDRLENADGATRAVLATPSGGYPADALQRQFEHSLAVIIGINEYKLPEKIRTLHTAQPDAEQLAALLQDERRDPHDRYEMVPLPLYDEQATGDALRTLLEKTLPARVRECGPKTRVLFYFAGHGDADDTTRKSFLFPQDADPDDEGTLLPMAFVQQALAELPCQHVLIILDCCSAGALPTAKAEVIRGRGLRPTRIYWEYLSRFVGARTRQVITSAGARQQAADRPSSRRYQLGQREGDDQEHSPFAQALFEALDPDKYPNAWGRPPGRDGVVTATELYLHIAEALAQGRARQTPGLWTLTGKGHDQGEYVFLLPGAQVTLEPEPELSDPKTNPWPGLRPFRSEYDYLFAGRDPEIDELAQRVASHPLGAVIGPSRVGKTSLVQAGLLPRLVRTSDRPATANGKRWHVLPPFPPDQDSPIAAGEDPLAAIGRFLAAHLNGAEAQTNAEAPMQADGGLAVLAAAWAQAHPLAPSPSRFR